MAAAIAPQKSTSNPVHVPRSSREENPGHPSLTPQTNDPPALTAVRVGDGSADQAKLLAARTYAAAHRSAAHPSLSSRRRRSMRKLAFDAATTLADGEARENLSLASDRDGVLRRLGRPCTNALEFHVHAVGER